MVGGEHIFVSPTILGSDVSSARTEDKTKQKEKFLAMCFFMHADERRYGELHEELKKGVFRGRDEYPVTVSDAYEFLIRTSRQIGYQRNHRMGGNRFRGGRTGSTNNFMLVQNRNDPVPIPGNDGVLHEDITCYSCRSTGHYAGNCPNRGVQAPQTGMSFTQNANKLESIWVLLDTCSTHSVSNNKELVKIS